MAKLPVVDATEREEIRAALKRYKSAHGDIGDPELHQRMMRALGCLDSELPLATLQRFLRGKHRTEDRMVRKYMEFLRRAAPPPPYATMGNAVVSFFTTAPTADKPSGFDERIAKRFAKRYYCFLRGELEHLDGAEPSHYPGFPVPESDSFSPPYEIPYSIIHIEPLAGTNFLRVLERVVNPSGDPVITDIDAEVRSGDTLYEGVLAFSYTPDVYLVVLRGDSGFAAGALYPRMYMLHGSKSEQHALVALDGSCMTISEDPATRSVCPGFEVRWLVAR